STKDTAPAPMI
ncbi:hypothetical protein MTO96_052017, partial [Rhipicephalus appendiculatus]